MKQKLHSISNYTVSYFIILFSLIRNWNLNNCENIVEFVVSVLQYIYIYIYKRKKNTNGRLKKKKCWCLWAGSLAEVGWEGLLLVKVGVKRKVGVDMDWRVDTWDSKRCACEWPKIRRQWNFIQCLSLSLLGTL